LSFNIIVSTLRNRENEAISELWYLFREIGDESISARRAVVPGLLLVKTSLNPFEAVHKLEERAKERPWDFRYVLKLTPIQVVVPTSLNEISTEAVKLANKSIALNESFKISINKRATQLKSEEIIGSIASNVNRKVNLTNPDKVILVEVVGPETGISVLKPSDIVSIVKLIGRGF